MAWYDWLFREKKESASGAAISAVNVGNPAWTPRDYEKLAKEAYQQNAIAFRCIDMVAQAVASIPLLLKKGDEIVEKHPLLDLLNAPAPQKTFRWLTESTATYLQIAGNAYIESVGPKRLNSPPLELWVLRPDRMKVVVGQRGMVQRYEYSVNGKTIRWEADQLTGHSNILHLKKFNPIDDWYGMSSVEAAAFAVDRHNEAGAHNMAVLQNGATPSGAMIFKPVKGGKGDGDISAPFEVIEAAEKRLKERYAGTKNAGRPLVLGGNVDWVSYGMTMEELQLTESKLDAARDICIAFGVPIELLLPGQSTFNNKREAKLAFYEETVLPLANAIIEMWNIWLTPRFGEGLTLVLDLDAIQALSLRREIRQENTMKLYNGGLIGRDEAREALQFELEPDMPQQKIDSAVLSTLSTAAQADEIMMEPLFNYMKSVGLIDKTQTFEQYIEEAIVTNVVIEEEEDPEESEDNEDDEE